ncbi:MAG TPA: MFS transporter [Lentisphaeria bacterium]|nr:MFS transporter [Lentisphaeria bacterium]
MKIKNRWLIAASAVGIHLSIGSVYSWSVFSKPIIEQTGWSLKNVQLTFSISILFLGLSAALLGHLVEKLGPRKTGMIAAIFFGVGIAGSGLAILMGSMYGLYLCYGVLGGIGLGVGYIAPVSTLVKWFPDRRGLATGLAIMGFGFASLIAGPITHKMILNIGLANTFFTLGLVYFVIIFASSQYLSPPPAGWVPEGWKGESASQKKKIAVDLCQLMANEAVKTRRFAYLWLMLFINITCGIAVISVASAMAQESTGMSAASAAFMVGIMGLFNGGGRIAWASLSDYIGRPNAYTMFFALQMVMFFLLSRVTDPFVFQILIFLIMTCYGGGFACIPAYIADLFGTRQLGAIHGYILTAWAAAGLAGPVFVAWVRQTSGGYSGIIMVFLGLFAVALTISLLIRIDIRRLVSAKAQVQPVSLGARTFTTDPGEVAAAIRFAVKCAESVGLGSDKVFQLELAVEEAATNICSHAYLEEFSINRMSYAYQAKTTYEVRIIDTPDSFSVVLLDSGIPFDPLSVAPADTTSPIGEREPDRLGVLLMRKMVDDIRYVREKDRNHLTLVIHKKAKA